MTLLRSWGVQIIIYINDMLILVQIKEEATQHLEVLLFLLEALGFMLDSEKSHISPTQEIEFLGLTINSSLQLKLPGEKIQQIRKEATQLQVQHFVSARQLLHFLGKLNAASQAMWAAPLFYWALQRDLQKTLLHGPQDYESLLEFSRESQEELVWWQSHLTQWNGRTVIQR